MIKSALSKQNNTKYIVLGNETDLPNKIVLLLRQSEDDSFTITTTLPLNISPNTDVKWMKNGKNISRKDEKYACNTGEVLQLKLQSFDVHDEGRYWCVLSTNSLRVESNHISIKYGNYVINIENSNHIFSRANSDYINGIENGDYIIGIGSSNYIISIVSGNDIIMGNGFKLICISYTSSIPDTVVIEFYVYIKL